MIGTLFVFAGGWQLQILFESKYSSIDLHQNPVFRAFIQKQTSKKLVLTYIASSLFFKKHCGMIFFGIEILMHKPTLGLAELAAEIET